MKNITERFVNEWGRTAQLTADECECLLRIMVECGFVKEMKRYNNPDVEEACVSAIEKLEEVAEMEGESILDK